MKSIADHRSSRIAFIGGAIAVCTSALFPVQAAERGPVRRAPAVEPIETEARVIVKFKADSSPARALSASAGNPLAPGGAQQAQALSRRLGLALTDGRPMSERMQVVRGSGIRSEQLAARLAAQPDVEYAVVDGRKHALAVTPNDPLFGAQSGSVTPAVGQWYLQASTTTLISAINATGAWGVTLGSSNVVVADLDTGARFDHPDLSTKLVAGYDFVGGANTPKSVAIANDGDGRDSDASDPGDWITAAEANQVGGNFYHCGSQDSSGNYVGESSSWHGTQTAGLLGAATDNGIGMASVGRNVRVQPLRVLGKCGGYDSDIIDAMRWAAGISVPSVSPAVNPTPARVINLSLGATEACSTAYQDAINDLTQLNVVVVVASGNEGVAPDSPANCSGVVSVSGVRHMGTKVGYSNLGNGITISAPAGNCVNATGTCLYPILTTSNSGTQAPVAGAGGAIYTDGNNASLGTSFSAPLVAGTVALMYSADPQLTSAQAINALKSTARAFPSTGSGTGVVACTAPTSVAQDECYCTTATCGAGLLDAGAAVTAAAALAPIMAGISTSTSSVVAGASVTFDGTTSVSALGGLTYLWSITSGSTLASFSSATNATTVTLLTSAAGSVTVTLTVTDSAARTASSSAVLTVTAPTVVVPSTPVTTSSGGGGGAMSIGWLLAWLLAVAAVRQVMPRRRA